MVFYDFDESYPPRAKGSRAGAKKGRPITFQAFIPGIIGKTRQGIGRSLQATMPHLLFLTGDQTFCAFALNSLLLGSDDRDMNKGLCH